MLTLYKSAIVGLELLLQSQLSVVLVITGLYTMQEKSASSGNPFAVGIN